jgi:hypothetical protein
MKVSVFGQRNVTDESVVKSTIDSIIQNEGSIDAGYITFLWGGAKGVQEIVYYYLKDEYDFVIFKPWTKVSHELNNIAMEGGKFNTKYFYLRNKQIIQNSDLVVILDNGQREKEVDSVKELCSKLRKELLIKEI